MVKRIDFFFIHDPRTQNELNFEKMFSMITRRLVPMVKPIRIRAQYIATTTLLQKIYTVQSVEDFNEKVRKSKTPVVVDFYAT